MRLSIVLGAALLALPARADAPPPGEPDAATLTRIAPAILRVVARGCAGDEPARAGSGFTWPRPGQVVTDLHVIAGCTRISVGYQQVDERPAHVVHVLLAADLALLQVDGPPATPVLAVAAAPPAPGATVEVFGFALGQPTRDTHPLHLTFANQEAPLLGDVLPDAERADIRGVGFPALDTQVLRLDGNLLPGHSGAPLIDNAGQVVGIGSGGLERGAVGVGWAVRAQYLQRLLQSADALPAGGTEAATAFATAAPATGASDKVTCGGMTLTLRRTLRLARIAASASDPHGLDHLADGLVQVKPGLLAANKFSIWTEPGSAAGVVIPSALPLEAGPDYCIVHAMAGPVRYLIRLVKLPQDRKDPAWAAQVRAEELRSAALIDDAVHARLAGDAGGAFRSRHWVQGALVVHRLFKGRAADGRSILVYRSDLAGRGAYILNAVIDDDAAAADPTARAKAAWARGVFAVHLTGFPPVEGVEPPSP